ncbi:MAG: 1-phosphofructokinase family hexose kinase [Fimbriimonadaceae bacterium]|nr:1-phosphofructokinase family hexose kinase [Fimbriimonadaceae bacterium]QYK56690.1 MAG: 1-phosphofructokinase family hexose kinase [Fimbriimonadaceae bacterium]
MILTVTLNPAVDETLFVEGLHPHDRNRVTRVETDAGGKGVNLSRVAAELGAETVATGFLGGQSGMFVRTVLDRQGVRHDFVEVATPTRTNVLVEDGSGKPPTVFSALGPVITGLDWENLLGRVAQHLGRAAWVCTGGSNPQGLEPNSLRLLGEMAKNAGVKWALDADGDVMEQGLDAGPDLIKPNGDEAARLLGSPVRTVKQALEAADALTDRLHEAGSHSPTVIVSLGAQGAVMACQDRLYVAEPIEVESNSTIGSGDSLVAGFLVGLSRGLSPADCLRLGSAAGAATALTDGTEIGRRSQIEGLFDHAKVRLA